MTHDLVRMMLKKLIPAERFIERPWPVRLGVMGIYIAVIFLVAVGTYCIIEVRGRRMVRGMLDRVIPAKPGTGPNRVPGDVATATIQIR